MKQSHAKAPDPLDPVVDAENAEFDFSDAPRPGRNELFELAQGRFHEVTDAEDRARSETRLLRIRSATPLDGRRLRLTLTDGSIVERDIQDLLYGPVFDRLRTDDDYFRRVRARYGTVTWPGDVDIAPETLIWDGPTPDDEATRRPEPFLRPQPPRY